MSTPESYKTLISTLIQETFASFVEPGLHVCELPTGIGKTHALAVAIQRHYLEKFDRIIVLCPQIKHIRNLNDEIKKLHKSNATDFTYIDDLLVVENNTDSFRKVLSSDESSNHLEKFFESMRSKGIGTEQMEEHLKALRELNKQEALSLEPFREHEGEFRKLVKDAIWNSFSGKPPVSIREAIEKFPGLNFIYPQVELPRKKVILMTVDKAMYGVDLILQKGVQRIQDLVKGGRTLVFFDESDSASISMKRALIDLSLNDKREREVFKGIYEEMRQCLIPYESALSRVMIEQYSNIRNVMDRRLRNFRSAWKRNFGDIEVYHDIILSKDEEIGSFRTGTFLCGPLTKITIGDEKKHSYICHILHDTSFRIFHGEQALSEQRSRCTFIKPIDDFITQIQRMTNGLKSGFYEVCSAAFLKEQERYSAEIKKISDNQSSSRQYIFEPTLEKTFYSFFKRFFPDEVTPKVLAKMMCEFSLRHRDVNVDNARIPDLSVYSQGVEYIVEEPDMDDALHSVSLSRHNMSTTPEKVIAELVDSERKGTSVVLCSATAARQTIVSNFDLQYLKSLLGGKMHYANEHAKELENLSNSLYPKEHKIEIVQVSQYDREDARPTHKAIPQRYLDMFDQEALYLVGQWYDYICDDLEKRIREDISFMLNRFFQFVEAYHFFYTHKDIQSMVFFQNPSGDDSEYVKQYTILSILIDGTFRDIRNQSNDFDGLTFDKWCSLKNPTGLKNEVLYSDKNIERLKEEMLKLGTNKNARIFYITSYGTLKTGVNLQYSVPLESDCLRGSGWDTEAENIVKDWDAVYLQKPTCYLPLNSGKFTDESFLDMAFSLQKLQERGYLSPQETKQELRSAYTRGYNFSVKNHPSVYLDQSEWLLTVLEQAVGRICRTKNKPRTTYILYDDAISGYLGTIDMDKPMTKEFRAFADAILNGKGPSIPKGVVESNRCNLANQANRRLRFYVSCALEYIRYSPDDIKSEDMPREDVLNAQKYIQKLKEVFLRYPVVPSSEWLREQYPDMPLIDMYYGAWPRRYDEGYAFWMKDGELCDDTKGQRYYVSPLSVQLEQMMRCREIRSWFEEHEYATKWSQDGLILHPQILSFFYAGELGEQAFLALMRDSVGLEEGRLEHLTGKDYELADFVIKNPDGTNRVAFDIKNYNPDLSHEDKIGDVPTAKKRAEKEKRLGCRLMTVNIMKMPKASQDISEITGLIESNGNIVESAIRKLKEIVG